MIKDIDKVRKMFDTYNKNYDIAEAKQEAKGYSMAQERLSWEEYKQAVSTADEMIRAGEYRSDTSHINRDIIRAQTHETSYKQAQAIRKAMKEEAVRTYAEEKGVSEATARKKVKLGLSISDIQAQSIKDPISQIGSFVRSHYDEFKKNGKITFLGKEYEDWQAFMGENVVGSK